MGLPATSFAKTCYLQPPPARGKRMCKVFAVLAVWVVAVGIAGCARSPEATRPGAVYRQETVALPTAQPTVAPTPSSTRVLSAENATATPTPHATPTITPIPTEARGLVVQVINGDTVAVVLEGDPPGRAYLVRYLGIDAPPNEPDNPWGMAAYETNRKMTNLKVVRLVKDQTETDDEGRLLRYVYVGDQLMSIILAEQGLARANIVEPDTRFAAEITQAESRAKEGRLGLWGPLPTPTPAPGKTATPESEETITATAAPAKTGTPAGSAGPTPSATQTGPAPAQEASPQPTAGATAGADESLQGPQ